MKSPLPFGSDVAAAAKLSIFYPAFLTFENKIVNFLYPAAFSVVRKQKFIRIIRV